MVPTPANDHSRPGPFGDEVRHRVPGLRAARRGSPTRSPSRESSASSRLPSRLLRTTASVPLVGGRDRPGGAAAAARRPRRAGVRRVLVAPAPARPPRRLRRAAAAPRRAAPAAARPVRVVLGLGALRPRADGGVAAGARPRAPAGRWGWARASARSPLLHAHYAQARRLRRALPPVGQLLPAAVRLARVRVRRASAGSRGSSRAVSGGRGDAGPDPGRRSPAGPARRTSPTTAGSPTMLDGHGWPVDARRAPATRTTGSRGATRSTPTSPT